MRGDPAFLRHPMLEACGVEHGFGVRGAVPPESLLRPRQVHGIAVAVARAGALEPEEADAVVCADPGRAVGVVTADCVPVLVAAPDGQAVAAIHAGWRGLAAGVIETGITALRHALGSAAPGASTSLGSSTALGSSTGLVAVIGPRIGACCYEVDTPVFDALRHRFGERLELAVQPSRPGHGLLDLAGLVRLDLLNQGLGADTVSILADACTHCDSSRFDSYRRDGAAAGRLVHHVAATEAVRSQDRHNRSRLDMGDPRI